MLLALWTAYGTEDNWTDPGTPSVEQDANYVFLRRRRR